MIPLPGVRDKAGGPLLGAAGPGEDGPYGDDDGQDDDEQ